MKYTALLVLCTSAFAAPQIAIEGRVGAPARYGIGKLQAALANSDCLVRAGIKPGLGREALSIRLDRSQAKPTLILAGGDDRGLMYAALEVAERVKWANGPDPFQQVREMAEKPYLSQRGISMYTMQRAWFESRLYDERHWQRYFDMLAADRINNFVVIFGYENGGFMAPLYPYFFNVDKFPDVELVGINAEQQAKNIFAFRKMIALAHERGIEITAGIWDHIYRGGVQGGGIPGASQNAGKRVPGLVAGVTADNLAPYTKAALKKFLETFPDIDSIQFRMHDESGLKKDEIVPFWHDVFASIKENHPALRLDLRAKGLPDAVIDDALGMHLQAQISTKFWMEQMGLPFHPTHINTEDQRNRRHSYADLLTYPQRYRVHWQLWSGGTTRLLLWGDPEYARRFAESAKLYDGGSFEVNEMLATWMLGEPHDEAPLPILNPAARYTDYPFERYWQFYRLFGRLSYNPETPSEEWDHEFIARFGAKAAAPIERGLELASRVLPRIVAASYRYSNFPTTRGWAEMNRQGNLPEYATEQGSDIAQFMNVRDEARSIVAGTDTAMRRPEETSRWFAQTADAILAQVAAAGPPTNKEFASTVTDLKILAGLARYHSRRLLAGVAYNLQSFDDAIAYEKSAIDAWKTIVAAAGDTYSENLAFGPHAVGFSRHWKEELALLEKGLAALTAKPGGQHVALRNPAPDVKATILPENGLKIAAKVEGDPKTVRLRYRHLTQYEDYQTLDMKPTEGSVYRAEIPADFASPKWALMYYIEVIGKNGDGRIFPDLEVETPYRILPK